MRNYGLTHNIHHPLALTPQSRADIDEAKDGELFDRFADNCIRIAAGMSLAYIILALPFVAMVLANRWVNG